MTGYLDNLTTQQSLVFSQLREQLNTSQYAPDLSQEPSSHDTFLLRFLRATMRDKSSDRIFVLDAAYARLVATFEFRRLHGYAEVIARPPEKYELFQELYPCVDVVNESTGQLVRFNYFGKFVSNLDCKIMSGEDWIKCFIFDSHGIQVILTELSKRFKREISTYVSVADASGISLIGVAGRVDFIKSMSGNAADHFPETLGRTLIIQCPWLFPKIFAVVRPFLDKDTLSKFVLCSTIPVEEFEKLLPKKDWPKAYGGDGPVMKIPLSAR